MRWQSLRVAACDDAGLEPASFAHHRVESSQGLKAGLIVLADSLRTQIMPCASQIAQIKPVATDSSKRHTRTFSQAPRPRFGGTRRQQVCLSPWLVFESSRCYIVKRSLSRTASSSDQQQQGGGSHSAEDLLEQLQPVDPERPGALQLGWTPTALGESIRGVVATGSHPGGSTILSVPAPLVLTDIGHDKSGDLPWSGFMAVQLLQKLAACSRSEADPKALTCTWLESLPKEVVLAAGACHSCVIFA